MNSIILKQVSSNFCPRFARDVSSYYWLSGWAPCYWVHKEDCDTFSSTGDDIPGQKNVFGMLLAFYNTLVWLMDEL